MYGPQGNGGSRQVHPTHRAHMAHQDSLCPQLMRTHSYSHYLATDGRIPALTLPFLKARKREGPCPSNMPCGACAGIGKNLPAPAKLLASSEPAPLVCSKQITGLSGEQILVVRGQLLYTWTGVVITLLYHLDSRRQFHIQNKGWGGRSFSRDRPYRLGIGFC